MHRTDKVRYMVFFLTNFESTINLTDFDILSFCFQKKVGTKGQFKGVSFYKVRSNWEAKITHEGNRHFLGYFSTELEAAQAVNEKCVELGIPLKNPEIESPGNKRRVSFISKPEKQKSDRIEDFDAKKEENHW